MILAVDPGTHKCGLAVLKAPGAIVARQVVPTAQLGEAVQQLMQMYEPERVLLGDGTAMKKVRPSLQKLVGGRLQLFSERHTTERARARYFQDHPPRGLWRLVPLGLQVPSVPYDDYAAVVLAEDYFRTRE